MAVRAKELNGLRGASSLAVLFYHALGFGTVGALYYRLGFGGGFAAVYTFFALSAFLLTQAQPRSWVEYYTHRVFRIFPVWLVVLPAFVLLGIIPFSPAAVALLQNWFPSIAGIGNPTWTLTIELAFYTALPAWLWVLNRAPWVLFGACASISLACVVVGWNAWGFAAHAGGSLLAYAAGSLAARGRLPKLAPSGAAGLLLAGFGASAVWLWAAPIAVALASALMLGNPPRVLGKLSKVGEAAYPIYLLGYPLLFVGNLLFVNPWTVLAFNVGSVLALAALIHRYVEHPFIQMGHAIARRTIARSEKVYIRVPPIERVR